MAFKRFRKRRRTTRRVFKRGFSRRRQTRRIARTALRVARRANKREPKFYEEAFNGFYPGRNATDSAFDLTPNIVQGTTALERVGDSVILKYLTVTATITLPDQLGVVLTNVTNRQNFIRFWVAVIPDPDSAGINSDISDIFAQNNFQWLAPLGLKRWDTRFDSRLIYNRVFKINTFSPQIYFRKKIKLNFSTQWQIGGIAPYHNRLVYGFQSDNTTGVLGGTYAYVHHIARLTYIDP